MTRAAIRIENVSKAYGEFVALAPLDLMIQPGEIFGFLGPNGAGKTTTIRILMGILIPSSGRVTVEGLDSIRDRVEIKRRVGYLPDHPGFHDFLRGREILEFVAQMHGQTQQQARANARRLLQELQLEEACEDFAVNYSTGMLKKLGLACAMVHDPSILILDEPTNGLDPRAASELQDRIRASAATGKTIFLSTHLLDMAERLCTRVGIINRGSLVATGTLEQVKARAASAASLEQAFMDLTAQDDLHASQGA